VASALRSSSGVGILQPEIEIGGKAGEQRLDGVVCGHWLES
jgi:hypothetical protein